MASHHSQAASHPLAIIEAGKKAPRGYALVGQYPFVTEGIAKKNAERDTGIPTSELIVLGGHCAYKGGRMGVVYFRDGNMVFGPADPKTGKLRMPRLVKNPKTGEDEPARKDKRGVCSQCTASPTVLQTGMCGPCTWGDWSTENGNW